MKKYLLIFSTVAMLLAGCSREQIEEQNGGGLQTVSFTANLDNGATTKAVADGDGLGTKATRCILELYYGDGLYYRDTQPVNNMVAEFNNITLVSNRTYEVLVWADAGAEYYNAEDLKAVKMVATQYIANDDERDAFFYRGQQQVAQRGEAYSVQLRRPFAQVNIITLDAAQVKSASLYPENVWMKYKAPTQFNIYTGELSEVKELTVSGPVYATFSSTASALTLEMDYLFAETERAALDIDFKAKHAAEADVVYAFTNIPIQRNYRTNIQGKLLTTTGSWTATIVPDWDGTHSVDYIEAGSIAAANEALKTNNAVSIEHPNDLGTAIVIPSQRDGENVYITVTGASAGDIVIEKAQNGPASLDIESDSKTLNINLPNSHVNINKGDYTSVTAKTSATTLVVGKDVEIDTLNILAGNAEIYGLVDAITRASGVKANWYAENRAKLIAGLNNSVAGESVTLTEDIDLNNEEWAPVTIGKAIVFDGAGHTIKNLKITETYPDSHYGLIGHLYSSGVIKNLTIDSAQILLPQEKGENSRGAVLVGIARSGNIVNCHVKNATVSAYQKVGGLVGQYSLEGSGTSIVKDCSVKNVNIYENQTGEGVWGAGGLIGSLCLVNNNHNLTVEGCTVKGIGISNSTQEACPKQTAHAFIGTIRDDAESIITLSNNTVEQATGLFTDIYSSEYFGWATNNESNPSFKCQIIIDGQAWVPNYTIKNVTKGTGYATLNAAVSASSNGDVINIEEAGEYTIPGISENITISNTCNGNIF